MRMLWSLAEPLFFRLSPRLFYGWRNFILRLFGAKIGRGVQIYPSAHVRFPWLLEIGEDSVISWNVTIYNLGKISIGTNTVISQNCHLCGGTHDYRQPGFPLLRTGLGVGSHVWIAADAFVGPGVVVGDHAVVAARAVVVQDVPPKTVVGGNPARVLKHIESKP